VPDTAAAPMDPDGARSPARISRLAAEAFGTFVLVFGGAGAALFASQFPTKANTLGIGYLGVALAFGLTVVGAGYAVGHLSGGHFNPAVTVGLFIAGKFPKIDVGPYIAAQILGGAIASSALAVIVGGGPAGNFHKAHMAGFASNGYGIHSPGGYNLLSVALIEVILTAIFVYVILGVTDKNAVDGFGPLAIGLTLTLIHLVAIPVDGTSVNPARSIATALYGGPAALEQLWVFILAPLAGAALAGYTHRTLFTRTMPPTPDH
jgi:aquaporin Z